MGLYIETLKQILRRKKKDPAYDLSAAWVLKQLDRPLEIKLLYDRYKLTVEEVRAVERFRSYKPAARQIFIQCTKLFGKIGQGALVEKAVAVCITDACLRATGIHVEVIARFY